MEPTEVFKEKYRAEGFLDGVLSERLQTLNLLGRIAEAPDVEGAVVAEHERLLALQAKQLGEQAQSNRKPGITGPAGTGVRHPGAAPRDLGDQIADLMHAPPAR
jgi:hypothetical protein